MTASANYDLKEEIRAYWSARAASFDLAFGHRIPHGPEFDAWQRPIREVLGAEPREVLELACGTGEVTRLVHELGHSVTALDFSEDMLRIARAKHKDKPRLKFVLADAENTMLPDARFDAILCRHLVWTLTRPDEAFAEWHRLLKPGGKLIVFDGDWASLTRIGRLARRGIALLDRWTAPDPHYDGAMSERHGAIMRALPFGAGLRFETLAPLVERAGFIDVRSIPREHIARAQRRRANLRNRLRTLLYRRFILVATKPQ